MPSSSTRRRKVQLVKTPTSPAKVTTKVTSACCRYWTPSACTRMPALGLYEPRHNATWTRYNCFLPWGEPPRKRVHVSCHRNARSSEKLRTVRRVARSEHVDAGRQRVRPGGGERCRQDDDYQ